MIIEVLKETFLHRRFIPVLHVLYLGVYLMIYAILCVIPSEPARWGLWLFAWSGCLFPILLTAGIFGDDIASGRVMQLVIKPISLGTLYLMRTLGVLIQCFIHLSVCYFLVFIMHLLTGQETKEHLGLWFLASLLASLTWLMLSASLSAVLLREYNVIVLLIGSILGFMLWQSATIVASIANWPAISEAADRMVIYGMPPVILLFRLGMQKYSMIGCVAVTLHTIAMAVLYAIVGIVILTHREYVRKRE